MKTRLPIGTTRECITGGKILCDGIPLAVGDRGIPLAVGDRVTYYGVCGERVKCIVVDWQGEHSWDTAATEERRQTARRAGGDIGRRYCLSALRKKALGLVVR